MGRRFQGIKTVRVCNTTGFVPIPNLSRPIEKISLR
ncbi:hypothetical protein COLO4_35538 [Corchorus olitorius]|uniref:Uncharacterized protein n=1 Tax=Corchorus olitorius TaxID=93759 RepID=A0A1R3GFL2_9ROSI|nr:hypothetical protein COLO4_35538 [Corchorus olitorius]